MKLYKLCFVFAGKLILRLCRQSTKELKYMKAKIKYSNNTFVTRHARVPPRCFIQIIYDVT